MGAPGRYIGHRGAEPAPRWRPWAANHPGPARLAETRLPWSSTARGASPRLGNSKCQNRTKPWSFNHSCAASSPSLSPFRWRSQPWIQTAEWKGSKVSRPGGFPRPESFAHLFKRIRRYLLNQPWPGIGGAVGDRKIFPKKRVPAEPMPMPAIRGTRPIRLTPEKGE